MSLLPQNISFISGAYWLTKLRWIAILWVLTATYISKNVFHISVQDIPFYIVCLALIGENIFSILFLRQFKKISNEKIIGYIKKLINFQISFDYLSLTILIHFSGGIENPVYIVFFFHMVISSILLSKTDSYIQTTFALLLLWLLSYFEYSGNIDHYSLWVRRLNSNHLYRDPSFIIETLSIFTLSSYTLVYMTNYIVGLLRKQEKTCHQTNIKLQKQDKIKNEYIQRVTHNIKGHLAAILTNLSVVKEQELKEQQEKFIHATYNRTIKLSDFINDLLKLTKMRLDEKPEIIDFSIREIIQNSIIHLKNSAESKSICLTSHIEDAVDQIKGNPVSIEELIVNLLENAIRYTPEGGSVNIEVKDKKSHILIQISDTGIGIPQEDLPYIFDEFFRAGNAKSIVKDGTGLGLSLAKSIVDRFHGTIEVVSHLGVGTTFYIQLPKKYQMPLS